MRCTRVGPVATITDIGFQRKGWHAICNSDIQSDKQASFKADEQLQYAGTFRTFMFFWKVLASNSQCAPSKVTLMVTYRVIEHYDCSVESTVFGAKCGSQQQISE